MNGVIGEVLPLALAVAVSPIPIIAAILLLLSPRARGASVGFLLGWVLGVVIVVVLFTLISGSLPEDDGGTSPVVAIVKLLLGVLLLFVALRQWRTRPKEGQPPELPKWMSAIDSVTAVRALLLGLALSALNPKNLAMGISAGVSIGTGGLSGGQVTIAIVVFVLIAISSVAIPVIGFLLASTRLKPALESLRVWLVANNAAVMTVLLLVLGVTSIGKGIASL